MFRGEENLNILQDKQDDLAMKTSLGLSEAQFLEYTDIQSGRSAMSKRLKVEIEEEMLKAQDVDERQARRSAIGKWVLKNVPRGE